MIPLSSEMIAKLERYPVQHWIMSVMVGLIAFVPAAEAIPNSSALSEGSSVPAIAQTEPHQDLAAQIGELIQTARQQAANNQVNQAIETLIQAEQATALLSNSATLEQLFATIATEQAKLGQFDRAIAITNRIGYTTLPPQECCVPVRTISEIAIVQAYLAAGQVDSARQFAEGIQFDLSRDQALIPIVAYLAEQGQFNEAIALSQRSQSYGDQARYAILKSYINADRFTDAVTFTASVTDPNEKTALLTTLARWAWRSGKVDLADQITSQIPELNSKVQLWVEVALAYANRGMQERAISILSQAYELTKTRSEPQAFAQWSDYFAQIGAFDRALSLANGFTGYEQAHARVMIAQRYANAGRYAEAIALTRQVPDGILQPFGDMPDLKVEALQRIVQQAVQAGQYDQAIQAVNELPDRHQVQALRAIAQQYRLINQPQTALTLLDQALAAARRVDTIALFYDRNTSFTVSNAELLTEIAQDYLTLDQPDRAKSVLDEALASAQTFKAENQNSVHKQVQYIGAIARLYSELEQRDRARVAAEGALNLISQFPGSDRSSVFPAWTIEPMTEVAQMYALVGDQDQAMEMLSGLKTVNSTIADTLQQLWGMVAIIKAYAAMGAESQMQETAESALTLATTLEPAQRDWVTGRIAVAAAASEPTYALQIIQRQTQQDGYIPTLAQIAVNYYTAGQEAEAQAVITQLQQITAATPNDAHLNDILRSYLVPQGARNLPIAQIQQAEQFNANVQSPNLRAYNWFVIAQAYAVQGETNRANQAIQFSLDAVKTMPDRFERRELLWQMVEEAQRAENPDLAAQIVTGFEEEAYRAIAF
jgi:hypothetical protein